MVDEDTVDRAVALLRRHSYHEVADYLETNRVSAGRESSSSKDSELEEAEDL